MRASIREASRRTPEQRKPPSVVALLLPFLGILGVALAYYVFLYVPSREGYFTERAFRQLAVLSEQFEGVIGGLDSAIRNAAETDEPDKTIQLIPNVIAATCNLVPCAFPDAHGRTSMCVAWDSTESTDASSAQLDDEATLHDSPTLRRSARIYFRFGEASQTPTGSVTPMPSSTPTPTCGGRATATGATPAAAPTPRPSLCVTATLRDLLTPLLGGTAFDDYDVFLANQNGSVLFERGRSGLRLADLPRGDQKSPQQAAGDGKAPNQAKSGAGTPIQGLPPIDALQRTSALASVWLGQTAYQLFTHPVRLVVPANVGAGGEQSADGKPVAVQGNPVWVLGALITGSRFAAQNRSLSFPVMIDLLLLVLLCSLAVPAFKLWAMSSRDRLRARDLYVLGVCSIAATALLTVFMLGFLAYHQLNQDGDRELSEFAEALSGNFRKEVMDAAAALQQFTDQVAQPHAVCLADLRADLRKRFDPCEVNDHDLSEATGDEVLQTTVLYHLDGNNLLDAQPQCVEAQPQCIKELKYRTLRDQLTATYPFFEQLSWADRDGEQREKWTTRAVASRLIRVKDLRSFDDVKEHRLWNFPEEFAGAETKTRELVLHVQVSPNTGDAVPTLSIPIWDANLLEPCAAIWRQPMPDAVKQPKTIVGVASMITLWSALVKPLTPPGVGFALIQGDGTVLFHPEEHRVLHENLFAECEPYAPLRAAVFARRAAFFTADYLGRAQRLYVSPLESTPWTLVVFRDKELLRTVHLEMVLPCVLLLLVYSALYGLAIIVLRRAWPEEWSTWLWPTPSRAGAYRQCMALVLGAIIFSAWVIHACCAAVAVFVCFAVSLASVTFAFLKLTQHRHGASGPRDATGERSGVPSVIRVLEYSVLIGVGMLVLMIVLADGGYVLAAAWIALALLAALSLMCGSATASSRRTLTASYVAMALSLLAVIAVIPAVALFQDAYLQNTEAFVRLRQMQHAEARAKRAAQLREEYEGYDTPDVLEKRLDRKDECPVTDVVPAEEPIADKDCKALLDHDCATDPHSQRLPSLCKAFPHGVSGPLIAEFPVYNTESQRLRQLMHGSSSDGRWRWCPAPMDTKSAPAHAAGAGNVGSSAPTPGTVDVSKPSHRHTFPDCKVTARNKALATLWFSDERFRTPGASRWWDKGCYISQAPVPQLRLPTSPRAGLLLGVFLIIGYVGYLAFGAAIAAIFGLRVDGEITPENSAAILTCRLLLQPERRLVETLRESAAVIDFQCADPLGWKEWLAAKVGAFDLVIVDHFEYRIEEAKHTQAKLELLEELVLNRRAIAIVPDWREEGATRCVEVHRPGPLVVVVSDVDPLPYFTRRLQSADERGSKNKYMTAEELNRWAHVLTHIGKLHSPRIGTPTAAGADLSRTLHDECQWTEQLRGIAMAVPSDPWWEGRSADDFIEYIGDQAEAYYRTLWVRCTEDERLVLLHLAAEGFVNPRSWEVVRGLMQRGLVRRHGPVRLVNESFKQFVLTAESPAQVTEWEKAAGASMWAQGRALLLVLLAVGGAFLFMTQRDLFDSGLTFIAALVGSLGTLLGFLRQFGSGRITAAAPEPANGDKEK